MQIEQSDIAPDITLVELSGRLDLEGARRIDEKFSFLTTTRAGRFVVDLSRVSFIASIGIRMLVVAAKVQAQRGGRFVVACPEGMNRRVLETAGLDQVFPILPDVDAARHSLAGN